MVVIGVDVHKHVLTAVAVDELGRELVSWSGPVDGAVLSWAGALEAERLWALGDCRHVSRNLERLLLDAGERLVRVPPRLTAPARRRGRVRGKSDAIDALAIASAALREPGLDRPRPQQSPLRQLKLLVDHRERPGCRAAPSPAAAALAPARARPDAVGPARGARPRALAAATRPPAGPLPANDPGADRA